MDKKRSDIEATIHEKKLLAYDILEKTGKLEGDADIYAPELLEVLLDIREMLLSLFKKNEPTTTKLTPRNLSILYKSLVNKKHAQKQKKTNKTHKKTRFSKLS